MAIMTYVVLVMLNEVRPMWYYVLAAVLFVLSQLDFFLLSKVICKVSARSPVPCADRERPAPRRAHRPRSTAPSSRQYWRRRRSACSISRGEALRKVRPGLCAPRPRRVAQHADAPPQRRGRTKCTTPGDALPAVVPGL